MRLQLCRRNRGLIAAAVCGLLLFSPAREIKAEVVHSEIKSGGPLAGFSIFLDSYYESLSHGKVPAAVREELTAIAGSSEDDRAVRQALVDYAMQFLGNPYVWGGTDPNTGADCSGFTQYMLKHAAGVLLNRTSREQQKQGAEVSSGEMRPGDLIFYSNSQGVINHVALYIGNGQVIHSASKKTGVKISPWNYRTPVSIKNVIG